MAFCLLLTSVSLFAQDENDIRDYIEKYKSLAIAEQIRAGVPASITLAQGIHESTAGMSELATKGNNHLVSNVNLPGWVKPYCMMMTRNKSASENT
ncbi:hypothetical protein EMGBS15_10080 [Filimonas sp.]|nr:hypothetical protein EMGBS15_10080 [Filimonas sp.]